MENVNKYPLPEDNPPSYDVAVGNFQTVPGHQYQPTNYTPQNVNNIPQSTIPQQFQYHQTPMPPYPQIPQNYQMGTVMPTQPCMLGTEAVPAQKTEIPRNIKIISYIGICVCIFVVIMAVRSRI